jgi:excisionase family DNA binding protein
MDDGLSTREAAALLGVSEASVRRWSDVGVLPVRRVGTRRERRFRAADVEHFAAQRHTVAQSSRRARTRLPAGQGAPIVTLAGAAVELFNHVCAFYGSDAGRLRLTIPFLAEGLQAGQPCFLLAHGEILEAYVHALRRMPGVDFDAARAAGRLVVADGPGATVEQALEFWEGTLWQAIETRAQVIRVVGEMASEREQFASEAEMLAYEVAINQTVKRFPCVVLCQYDARRFSGEAMLSALQSHPDLFKLPLGLFLN